MKDKTISIKILSINVGRSSSAHQIALDTAFNIQIDFLLIQEPYIFRDVTRKITRNHPSFECFTPVDDWSIRPRVLTYIRRGIALHTRQERPSFTDQGGIGDILILSSRTSNNSQFSIINIYNAPPGAINPGSGVNTLLSLPSPPHANSILAGDFNLHHTE